MKISDNMARLISLGLSVVMLVGLAILVDQCSARRYREEGRELKKELENLSKQRDSLKKVISLRDEQIEELSGQAVEIKERIVYIKVKNDEKVDSIRTLSTDDAICFLAEHLSEEAGAGR